jgi:B9 domain-containing protein 1
MDPSGAPTSFTVIANGQIESAEVRQPSCSLNAKFEPPVHRKQPTMQIPACTNSYLKFQFVAGEDWQLLDGLEEGITQAARVPDGTAQA